MASEAGTGQDLANSFDRLSAEFSAEIAGLRTEEEIRLAQARYLGYYLQEKGLLVKFYREFRDHATTDPTGYDSLKRVLGVTDMDKFQKQWEKFILAIRTG